MTDHRAKKEYIHANHFSTMKHPGVLFLLFCLPVFVFCQEKKEKTDKKLQEQVTALLKGFQGEAGVYVNNLRTGKTVALQADSLFPTASMIKVSILTGIMAKLETGELQYHQVMTYKDSLLYPGVDILGSFKDNERIELSKLMMLMLTMSDNTASLWLESLAGGGARLTAILDSLGFRDTRVNSRTGGRAANRRQYGWGPTTPREMVTLFEKIYTCGVYIPNATAL